MRYIICNVRSIFPIFKQVNPKGQVPTFVDVDGKVVADSLGIVNYLDERYPEPPLYNESTKARDLELIEKYGVVRLVSSCVIDVHTYTKEILKVN